jgi:hypothetical protein
MRHELGLPRPSSLLSAPTLTHFSANYLFSDCTLLIPLVCTHLLVAYSLLL